MNFFALCVFIQEIYDYILCFKKILIEFFLDPSISRCTQEKIVRKKLYGKIFLKLYLIYIFSDLAYFSESNGVICIILAQSHQK